MASPQRIKNAIDDAGTAWKELADKLDQFRLSNNERSARAVTNAIENLIDARIVLALLKAQIK